MIEAVHASAGQNILGYTNFEAHIASQKHIDGVTTDFGELPEVDNQADGNPGLMTLARAGETLDALASRTGIDAQTIRDLNPQLFEGYPDGPIAYTFKSQSVVFLQTLPPAPPAKTDTVRAGEGLWQFAARQLKAGGVSNPTSDQILVTVKSIARVNGYTTLTPALNAGDHVKISGSEALAAQISADAGARLGYAFEKLGEGLGAEIAQNLKDALPYMVAGGALVAGMLAFGPPGWASAIAFLGTLGLVVTSIKAVETFLFFIGAVALADTQTQVDEIINQYKLAGAASDIVNVGMSLGGYGLSKGIPALRTAITPKTVKPVSVSTPPPVAGNENLPGMRTPPAPQHVDQSAPNYAPPPEPEYVLVSNPPRKMSPYEEGGGYTSQRTGATGASSSQEYLNGLHRARVAIQKSMQEMNNVLEGLNTSLGKLQQRLKDYDAARAIVLAGGKVPAGTPKDVAEIVAKTPKQATPQDCLNYFKGMKARVNEQISTLEGEIAAQKSAIATEKLSLDDVNQKITNASK